MAEMTKAQKDFRLKWHRARMYENGMSKSAVQRKMGQMQTSEKRRPTGDGTPLPDKRSPYRKWASQEWKNSKPGQKPFQPDNGKSPWRNFTDNGGAKKILDKLDLGHDERQARYRKNKQEKQKVSQTAIQRRLAAQKKGKKAAA